MDRNGKIPVTPSVATPTGPPTVRRPIRRVARLLAGAAALLLACTIAITSGLWWSLHTERGTAWLLARLPGVQVDAPKGTLLGDFDAQRVVLQRPGGSDTLTLTGIGWRGLGVERPTAALWCRVSIDSLFARRVDLAIAVRDDSVPLKAPADLRLPIALDLRSLRIAELHINTLGATPLRDVAARLQLGANDGAEHRIDQLSLGWDRLQATGHAAIATAAPMAVGATIDLTQQSADTLPPWSASATLSGPLATLAAQATLRAAPLPNRAPQALDARATLHPFAAWPLGDLQAHTQALDLSAFSSAAPVTALSIAATATSTSANQAARIAVDLANPIAGRWNEGRLPLRSLKLELSGRPDQPSQLELRAFDAELGTAQAAAGHLSGQGGWSPQRWNLASTLTGLQPAQLDARAPAMLLSGPLTLAGGGTLPAGSVDLKAELVGQISDRGPARAVQLKLDASLNPRRLELRELQALAGGSRATLAGVVTQGAGDAPWAVKAQATLIDFDPAIWWPGRLDSPWRKSSSHLNANGKLELTVPAAAVGRSIFDTLAALRGDALLHLDKSLLVGIPVSGDATLHSATGALAAATVRLDGDGNQLRAEGRLSTSPNGSGDVWDVVVDGPALARLAPAFRLFRPEGSDGTLAGTLTAKAHVTGRWPVVTTTGQLDADGLRVGTLGVQQLQATWALGTSANAPIEAQATLTQASLQRSTGPGPSVESVQLQLKGTGHAHALTLRAESKAQPPAWTDVVQPRTAPPSAQASASSPRTIAMLQAQGGFVDASGDALAGWRGTLQRLELRSSAAAAAPLLQARDVSIEALWAGGPLRATVQPGRAELLGGAVRWSRITWQGASHPGAFAQIEAEADIEPLRVAPLLARMQPDFGWGGDLSLSGHVRLRSAPSFSADIVVERQGGDLTVTEESLTRTLGLTDLRLGLVAENGTWSFTQGVAGKTLGVFAGAVVAHTSPEATWPAAETPIQGVLELRVADLGSWGTWVPPGWRLGGALHSSASIGGRFGAPEYTGEIEGTKLSVRNFLQGVNVTDGDVAIHLKGAGASIERFTARAGTGSVKLEGNANFGDAPNAVLKLSADRFQLLGRVDRRIIGSGSGQLRIDAKTLALDGQFTIDEGLIDFSRSDAPTLSSDVEVVRAKSPATATGVTLNGVGAPSTSTRREVALDVRVALGEQLHIRGRGLNTRLQGDLRITSPGGRLAANGTVQAVEGTYAAYGQKLDIDRGQITFSGPIENPRLDIEATRPNLDIRVGVAVSGNAANPRVRLFSDPELSEIDKLSWLMLGRASDGLGRADTALLQRAAMAVLAGEGGGLTDQLIKAIGLDEVSVRQTDGEVRDTVISLGKQLSRRWYVGYEHGLNATTGSFQLIYRIARQFTLRAQSGDDNSLDVIWTWRWQ